MKKFIPDHYFELIEKAGSLPGIHLPKTEELLRLADIKQTAFHGFDTLLLDPLFYVADYTTNQYLYLDAGLKSIFGFDIAATKSAGPKYLVSSYWHPNDCKVFNEKILPEALRFLKGQPAYCFCNLSFSFNYRMRTVNGQYLTMLQRTSYYVGDSGQPLASVGFVIDITHFKEGTSIIHTIERIDRSLSSVSKTPLLKSVYYPDQEELTLSRREKEVLRCMAHGMSSKEIAGSLCISLNTVNNHRRHMLERTGAKNASDLLLMAVRHGLL